ncbi:MAG: ATP-dependent DNA helicase, partial [Alphaproteobacteria bacterium]|nr:ATP-dependent DNA helicase [Alphaproteobacteria bacterium]
ESLRMIVFDRVPWPRGTILQKARKKVMGGSDFDDRLTRLKLKQAYGRLVRSSTDHGVFVMLDNATPSRLLTAFPEGVVVERLGIAEVIKRSKEFLQQ